MRGGRDPSRSWRSGSRVLVGAAVAFAALLATPDEGIAAGTGSISGKITVGGIGVGGVEIEAELISESPGLGMATTAGDGTYQITGLSPGEYIVQFRLEEHISEWYDNRYSRETADPVVVVDGNDTPEINAQLSKGGSISGRVGDEHAGLSGQHIELYDLEGNKVPEEETTDDEGKYVLGSLIPGSYKVLYADAGVWYSEKTSFADADAVTVLDEQMTTGIDFFADTTGSISGTVTGEHAGALEDVVVVLVDSDVQAVDFTTTAQDGSFTFVDVPSGVYYLFGTDPLEDFADTWHLDSKLFDMAFGVVVGLRQEVTGKDIVMQSLIPVFIDIEGNTFENDIEWLAVEGITKGCNPPDNDLFCPDDFVTRGQMAAFLVRGLDLRERLNDPFVDDDGNTFEADIEKLAAAGITRGCNPPVNDMFCPDDFVTRGQMAAFIHRALTR